MENLIINDTEIIGKIEDIEKYFKNEMVRELKEDICFEVMQKNFQDMFDIILEIQENEQEAYNNNDLFLIKENSMGGFVYDIYTTKKGGE